MNALISVFTNPGDAHFWIFIALAMLVAILWRAKVPGMAFKALDDVGYHGWGISEQPGNQSANAEAMKDLSARMDRVFAS